MPVGCIIVRDDEIVAPAKFKLLVDGQDPVCQIVGLRLDAEQARAFTDALAGFWKLAGVDLVREQLADALPAGSAYDLVEEGLVVWTGPAYESGALYELHGDKELSPHPLAGTPPAKFRKLKGSLEPGGTLLDSTMVLYGSNLGNASSHDPSNLPILLAGGGFKHGQHLAFNREQNRPLANLYVTMLQRFGVETDHFGSFAGTLPGLETT